MPKRICLACGADRQELESMLRETEVLEDNGYGFMKYYPSQNRELAG